VRFYRRNPIGFLTTNGVQPSMNQSNQPNYVRAKQAAQHLSISRSTLWQWVRERKGEGFPQPIRLGQKVTLHDLNKLEAFVAAQAVKGGAK
jgi:predicted DNA-binding transcriptional regulator AlpA